MTVSFFPFNEAEIFQLTSSRRGWHISPSEYFSSNLFQLTSSRRGWQHILHQLQEVRIFQLTSSRRGWPFILAPHCLQKHFNSHPHEEDDNKCKSEMQGNVYFNSHPHEEDDGFLSAHMEVIYISTHILTKRMTKSVIRFVREILISTHILTKRMTGIIPCRFSFPDISTHILTKRMTVLQRTEKFKLSFQLTSSRRGWRRCFIIIWCYEQKLFQLTSSRRGWQS